MKILPLVFAIACACVAVTARAGGQPAPTDAMADLSLEQLSDIVVSSVSRQDTSLASVLASVYIISAADLRRSGARSLPEALRLICTLPVPTPATTPSARAVSILCSATRCWC